MGGVVPAAAGIDPERGALDVARQRSSCQDGTEDPCETGPVDGAFPDEGERALGLIGQRDQDAVT